jgi:hypothetical protein
MAPGGLCKIGLKRCDEGFGAGKSFVPARTFEGQRRPLTGLRRR